MANKRAPNGNGHIRQRSDGTWEARIELPPDTGTGKRRRKSIYGKSQEEVAKKLRQTAVDVDNGVFAEPARLTLAEWLDIWLKEYNAHVKPRTLIEYTGTVNHTIKPALGAVKLQALTRPAVQAFINGLQRRDKPLSANTIENVHGTLHRALEQAVDVEYIRTNPATGIKLPRAEKPAVQALDDNSIALFLDAIKGHPMERLFVVDLFTDLRQGELLGLTWDCVDFERGTIRIRQQMQLINGAYKLVALKNDKPRMVTPAAFVLNVLQEQRRVQAAWRLQAGKLWCGGDYVFTNELGEHMKRQTVYMQYKRVMASIGLPSMRFHDMRHSYATAALRSGDDIKTVQENLGHHTPAFTLEVYGHVTEQMRKESAQRMDAFISKTLRIPTR